jgi:UDP-glucose 4-epimerase
MIKHRILITGGGGFVGTQVAWELANAGHNVTIVDRANPVHFFPNVYKVEDYLDFISTTEETFDTVIHLAAEHLVEQSVSEPKKYYTNNVVKMKALLDVMHTRKIKNIVFSSSGNTYGRQGAAGPLRENLYYDPENPYASTKVAGELLIKDYSRAYGMKYVTFRYFNAAGADPHARFGYVQRPATHVIPILCNKILNEEPFTIYGSDYSTNDGTCVRDYVHVQDLARAHAKAIELFDNQLANQTFNIGGGSSGVSVKELVKYAGQVVGKTPTVVYAPRRAGDPAMLVADISHAKNVLDWTPEYDIRDIIAHAWDWEQTKGKYFETSK